MSSSGPLKRVLIGGGSGFVGGQLVHRLRQCGFHPVVAGREFDMLHRGARRDVVTYAELRAEGRLPAGTFGVVNLAGANIALPFKIFDQTYKDIVRASRVGTTGLFRDLILGTPAEERPKVFVRSSAIGIYPPSPVAEYDEDSVPRTSDPPNDFFQNLVRDWEAAGELGPDSGVRQTIVRTGLVLGRTGGIVEQSFIPFSLGLGGPMGSGKQWFPWVHVDDVCAIMIHALEHEGAEGVLNAVAPNIVTNKEWARAFGRALGRPAVIPMPAFSVQLMFGAERAAMFLSGQKVRPKRTLASGFEFIYPSIDEAAREFARPKNEEELARLKSFGRPVSKYEQNNLTL